MTVISRVMAVGSGDGKVQDVLNGKKTITASLTEQHRPLVAYLHSRPSASSRVE